MTELLIPVYVAHYQENSHKEYRVRPLFFDEPWARNVDLEKAMNTLRGKWQAHITSLVKDQDHFPLENALFNPHLTEEQLDLSLIHQKKTYPVKALLVRFKLGNQEMGLLPGIWEPWFPIPDPEDRYQISLAKWKEIVRREENEDPLPMRRWIGDLSFSIGLTQPRPKPQGLFFFFTGDRQKFDGQEELSKCGTCLNWGENKVQDQPLGLGANLSRLDQAFANHHPVVLVGESGVGKTTLLKVWAHQNASKSKKNKNQTWHLSPGRLISGMSYVGQWEGRWHAILDEAQKQKHLLYFDDFMGLFQAGQTSKSSLNMAVLLKPNLLERRLRLVIEMTPEAFQKLQERDRGLADCFHIIRIFPPEDRQNLQILMQVMRKLEAERHCVFDLFVLPEVLRLTKQFVLDQVMPGQAVGFLNHLARKCAGKDISRTDVLQAFQQLTGLDISFLDPQMVWEPDAFLNQLKALVVGQDEVLARLRDQVSLARVRLQDSGKPMGSFLLTGPTGVGKTQTAKALSRVLFGETTPLVRFDMNEYADPYAPMRLVGTPEQPEGLLTQALRQTPFCVLLLDEIEKAHPHVFDLLLQVLGEGRLSDALGRVAHFQHCFILLTSNLGVREANQTMGWAETLPNQATAGFRRALESFFRPEFINRLDYVLICEPLVLDDLQHVTGLVLASFWQRSGLKQRICLHEVEPEALAVLARRGFDAQLGARALKRAVESDLVTPLSRKLAEIPSDTPLFLRYCLQAGQPEWEVISLSPQRVPSQDRGSEADWLIFLENYLPALHERLAETAPEGLIPLDQLADSAYFLQKEQITRIQKGLAKARYLHRQGGSHAGESPVLDWSDAFPFASVWTERDLFRVIWPWRAQCERQGLELLQLNYPLSRSLQEAFWLDQSLRALPAQSTFLITSSRPDLASAMQSIFTEALTDLGVKVYSVPGQISVDGLPGVRLLQIQRGWHLILDGKGGLEWVCLGSADHTPANLKRVWQLEGPCIDLASGWIFVEKMSPAAWRSLLLHAFFVEECPWPLST